jgi:ornithine decarboxylase
MTMHATVPGALRADRPVFVDQAAAFIAANAFEKPALVISRDRGAAQYDALNDGLGGVHIHYAVKANPAPKLIYMLVKKGSGFDAASREEIELCLSQGAFPENISFGNTIKRASDIAFAHSAGVTLFAADSEAELDKIARHAPGAHVYIRLIVENSMADWPLSRKFGCGRDMLPALLDYAVAVGLQPYGLSFHVGSQTREDAFWTPVLDQVAPLWHDARAAGHDLQLLHRRRFPGLLRRDRAGVTRLCGSRHGSGQATLRRRAPRHGGAGPRHGGGSGSYRGRSDSGV